MNCIGPWAPAWLSPRMRPMRVSTRWMAARYCHGTPDAASAERYSARRAGAGGGREGGEHVGLPVGTLRQGDSGDLLGMAEARHVAGRGRRVVDRGLDG